MKGITKITLKGKQVKLSMTLGALEDYQDTVGADDIDKSLESMKNLRVLLSFMSEYAGNKVEPDEFKYLEFDQLEAAMKSIGTVSGNVKDPGRKKSG